MSRQERIILAHIRNHGSITGAEAMEKYGIMRLGARIYNLKAQGYVIDSITERGLNRWGDPSHWSRYYLKESD